jgi:hypothetical protein
MVDLRAEATGPGSPANNFDTVERGLDGLGRILQHKGIEAGIANDAAESEKLGMHHLWIPIVDNTAPTEEQVIDFLNFATDPANRPLDFHCEAGKGRTGVMAACYMMAVMGWDKRHAIAKALELSPKIVDSQLKFISDFYDALAAGRYAPRYTTTAVEDTPPGVTVSPAQLDAADDVMARLKLRATP